MQNVFIVGSKGVPGTYGGYETFVDKLTEYHADHVDLKYHIACKSADTGEFEYHNAHCFKVKVPNIGPAQAIYYDVAALRQCMMVKNADLLICDSKNIEKYIHSQYEKYRPNTTFIAYGAETRKSALADHDEKLLAWYKEKGLSAKSYYLVVGRFVPENNYEIMIREFMQSRSKKDFALITNVSAKFLDELKAKTGFDKDPRIKFVGTVYDQELLMKIRENAYGYFHGHEVGGTNPSLLEALSSTEVNLLLNVAFNRECGEDGALYWSKEPGDLARLIEKADKMSSSEVMELGSRAKKRITDFYSWRYIANLYEKVFLRNNAQE